MEENYSLGKRFGDKFWKCLTIDVLSVGFLFLWVSFVAARESWDVRKLRKYLGRISLELIQWLGLSLRNFTLFDLMVHMQQDYDFLVIRRLGKNHKLTPFSCCWPWASSSSNPWEKFQSFTKLIHFKLVGTIGIASSIFSKVTRLLLSS